MEDFESTPEPTESLETLETLETVENAEPLQTPEASPQAAEVAPEGETVALQAAPSNNSEVIVYSEQIGQILHCNIAILICMCFFVAYSIFERFFKS